VDGLMESKTR